MSSAKYPKGYTSKGDPLLGQRILLIRKKLKLNQREFGKKVGISATALGRYEKGVRYPGYRTLARIAELGKVDIWWLTGTSEIEEAAKAGVEGRVEEFRQATLQYLRNKPIEVTHIIARSFDGKLQLREENPSPMYFRPIGALLIECESLEPLARPGQYLLVLPHAELEDGQIVVIKTFQQNVYAGYVFHGRKSGTYELQSLDSSKPQPSITVREKDIDERFRIIGVVFERLGPS